ncbi:MAG: protein-L-isoaspartate(D-aspartate) O-methyltransferase [Verrucomicrobiota bacterium]|nr:protein-L-isoaspartate(D-aspartate) O-methyltransferase [Verrucomicrobiota bacterium]
MILDLNATLNPPDYSPEEKYWAILRAEMVERQIKPRGITCPRVLYAMGRVMRHRFVPEDCRHASYADHPLPIGHAQTISQPYIVALMTDLLRVRSTDRILEIGTGCGYQSAVLAELAHEVFTIEIQQAMAHEAMMRLRGLGYAHIHCRQGDGYGGWPEQAPFDGILVTAAAPHIPAPLLAQLKPGGRLIIPVGTGYQELCELSQSTHGLSTRKILPVRFVPMTGKILGH